MWRSDPRVEVVGTCVFLLVTSNILVFYATSPRFQNTSQMNKDRVIITDYVSHISDVKKHAKWHGNRSRILILTWSRSLYKTWPEKWRSRFCDVTHSKARLEDADALLLDLNNYTAISELRTLPRRSTAFQYVIGYARTPQPSTSGDLVRMSRDVVNVTMSYRADSNLPVPYGIYVPLTLTDRDKVTPVAVLVASKTKLAFWIGNQCSTTSRRETYLSELGKHMTIDMYGSCGNMQMNCSSSQSQSCTYTARSYKFYMAFEDELCVGYVTHEAWHALRLGVVPVVLGLANYEKLLPPHSYIDVKRFNSPGHLARFLLDLDKDDEAFGSYLYWRREYRVFSYDPRVRLCGFMLSVATKKPTLRASRVNLKSGRNQRKCVNASEFYSNISVKI